MASGGYTSGRLGCVAALVLPRDQLHRVDVERGRRRGAVSEVGVCELQRIHEAIRQEDLSSDTFVLGPDLPDVSSTAARHALRQADHEMLSVCLHPNVVAWFEQNGPYRRSGGAAFAAPPPTPLIASTPNHVHGAGFIGGVPRQLRASDFGVSLPSAERLWEGPSGCRQRVLLETLAALEAASVTARYHKLAQANLQRWHEQAAAPPTPFALGQPRPPCKVVVRAGDWGDVTKDLTMEYGTMFAALNMANAYGPGGGYTHGMVAQVRLVSPPPKPPPPHAPPPARTTYALHS
jgi:hypothetical protein